MCSMPFGNSGARHVAGEAHRSITSPEAAPPIPNPPSEIADDVPGQADESAINLNPKQTAITRMAVSKTNDTYVSRASINQLPDEMLTKIFCHMSFSDLVCVVPKVCSRWRRLSQCSELWHDKEYNIGYASSYYSNNSKYGGTDYEAIQTFRDAPNLRTVRMWRRVKMGVFRGLFLKCHRLTALEVHRTQTICHSVLMRLVENCTQIQTLWISNELLKSEKFSKTISRLQYLRMLYVDVFLKERTPVLRPLGDGCPRLAEVYLANVNLDIDDLSYFLSAKKSTLKSIGIPWAIDEQRSVLPFLTVCADNLECLKLNAVGIVGNGAREAFTALGSMKNLKELEIVMVTEPPPTGTFALAFSGGLPKLIRLGLWSATGLEDDTVIALSRGCPALRELTITEAELLSDTAFSEISHLKNLERLEVSSCYGLDGTFIPYIVRLPRLHTLLLEELNFRRLQPGVSSIVELSGLRSLTLNYSNVTGVPFDNFPGKLVSLRELNVVCCEGDPKSISGLAEQMPGLEIHGIIESEESSSDEHLQFAD